MKNAAVENTQPTLGQLCVLKEGLDFLGEALAGLRRMGLFQRHTSWANVCMVQKSPAFFGRTAMPPDR